VLRSRIIEGLKSLDAWLGARLVPRCAGARRELHPAPRDVLVVRLWGLGNLALLAPLMAAQGDRRVRLLTLARHRRFLERHLPQVETLLLPEPTSPAFLPATLAAAFRLRRDPPDVVVEAETFLRLPALLVRRATRAPVVGMDTPGQGRSHLLDHGVRYDPTRHVASTFAALFGAAGLPSEPVRGALTGQRSGRRALAARLGVDGPGPLVLLHPGSGDHFPGRRWAPDRFASLARALSARGCRVAVTGSRGERALTAAVVAAAGARVHDLTGRVDAGQLTELLELADLLVTNDTGPLHLADVLGVPVVGLFGPNTPHRYGPRGPRSLALFADLPCSPCLDDRLAKSSACRDPRCMTALAVPAVLGACLRLLPAAAPVAIPVTREAQLAVGG
jgi:heptosyltransferase-2